MYIKVPSSVVESVQAEVNNEWLAQQISQSPLQRFVILEGIRIPPKVLKALRVQTKDVKAAYAQSIEFLYNAWKGRDDIRVSNMGQLPLAIVNYLRKNQIKGFMFSLAANKAVLPYVVTRVEDNVKERTGNSYYANSAIRVAIHMAHSNGEGRIHTSSLRIGPYDAMRIAEDLQLSITEVMGKPRSKDDSPALIDFECKKGIPVEEFFRRAGFFKETEEYHEMHQRQTKRFLNFLPRFGEQFQVRGFAETEVNRYSYWGSSREGELMLTEGKPGRCVMDTIPQVCFGTDDDAGKDSARSARRRGPSRFSYDDEGYSVEHNSYEQNDAFSSLEELEIPLSNVTLQDIEGVVTQDWDEGKKVIAPLHPTLRIFHLEKHRFFTVHVNNLRLYEYQQDIARYLILPNEVKQLAQMLVGGSKRNDVEDVIEGKSQSTVIALIGEPGVGKTLTAEVISEASKKPLYKIPADQLGGTAAALERSLGLLLKRAERWNAVLMIDEANAYVHARGIDIAQNAIVGVFLRLVEFYRGTLILTTNQTARSATQKQRVAEPVFDIDDAILSRCDAVIRLKAPEADEARDIWKVQRELLKLENQLSDEMIEKLVKTYKMSGRSIRKLLINSSRWAAYHNEKLALKHFKASAQFIPFTDIKVEEEEKE